MKNAIVFAIALCATLFVAGCQCGPATCGTASSNHRVWVLPNDRFGPGVITNGSIVVPVPQQPTAFKPPAETVIRP